MTVITHLAMIEMIDIHTKDQDIMRTYAITINKGMMTIDKLIVYSQEVTNVEMTIDNQSHPSSFNITLEFNRNQNHKIFDNPIS